MRNLVHLRPYQLTAIQYFDKHTLHAQKLNPHYQVPNYILKFLKEIYKLNVQKKKQKQNVAIKHSQLGELANEAIYTSKIKLAMRLLK